MHCYGDGCAIELGTIIAQIRERAGGSIASNRVLGAVEFTRRHSPGGLFWIPGGYIIRVE